MSKIWSERAPDVIGKHIGGFFQFPSLLANYSPFNTSFIGCEPLRKSTGTAAPVPVRQCLDLLLLEPNGLQFIPIMYKLLRVTDLQLFFHAKAGYTKNGVSHPEENEKTNTKFVIS